MDYKEFSGKIKAKYPQYSDMTDEDLASKIVARFPQQYGDIQLKNAPNSPTSTPTGDSDHPDDTMKYLAKMAKAIYGATPAGAIINLPALARGVMGREQPEGLNPTQSMAGAAGSAMRATAPAALRFAGENLDVMGGAGAGAMAALPFAPAAGPLAPLVPIAGAITGAVATRAAARPLQAALGRQGPGYATVEELAQAGKEGALQEFGGKALESGIAMGLKGLGSINRAVAEKAIEILPDKGQVLLSVPSESTNRVFTRYKEFSDSLKSTFSGPRRIAQTRADNIAIGYFDDLVGQLDRIRGALGRQLKSAEDIFVSKVGPAPIADAKHMRDALGAFKEEYPALAKTKDYELISDAIEEAAKMGDAITAKPAIKLRKELDRLSSWSSGGVRPIENDLSDRLVKNLGSYVRQNIRDTAEKLGGGSDYASRLTKFSDFVDAHTDAINSLRTTTSGSKTAAAKIKALSNQFNSGGAPQQALMDIGKNVGGSGRIETMVQKLADALAVRSFQEVPRLIPSGLILRIVNAGVPTRTAIGAAGRGLSGQMGNASNYAAGPTGKVASRLAAALAAQQSR